MIERVCEVRSVKSVRIAELTLLVKRTLSLVQVGFDRESV